MPALLIRLGAPVPTNSMEDKALVSSQESWLRWQEGEPGAWLVTMNDGQPRVEKPPMLAWLNFLAWSDFSLEHAPPETLALRARLVSAMLGLVMLGAIFWMGMIMADRPAAVIATLAVGSTLFFQRQARMASYDIQFVAWATLAVAAALWAIGPRAPIVLSPHGGGRTRRIAGWSICGIATACSVMSKNPLAFLMVLIPVIAAIALVGGTPQRRLANIIGAAGAMLVAMIPAVPWYWHVAVTYPELVAILKHEATQPRPVYLPVYYYFGLFGLIVPWTVWLICGLVQPWMNRDHQERRRQLIAWMWFVLIFVFFSIWAAKQQRYVLPILPAFGLLCAQVIREHQARADRGNGDRTARGLGAAIWIIAFIASLLFGPLLAMQDWLGRHAVGFQQERLVDTGWPVAIIVSMVLLAISIAGWRWNSRWKPVRSAMARGCWSLAFMGVFWAVDAGEPNRTKEVQLDKIEAERTAKLVGGAPLRSLRIDQKDEQQYKINEEFRFYYGRLIRHVSPHELSAFASQTPGPAYVLAKAQPHYLAALRDAGYRRVDDHIETDEGDVQELWVSGK